MNDVELIDEVVRGIKKKLHPIPFCVSTDLARMDSHMEKLVPLLSFDSADVRFVGIWGLGGIGKTTIAEVLLSNISDQFDEWCFLRNIRLHSSSNDELLHQRKRLLVELLHDENLRIEMLHSLPTFVLDRLKRKKVLVVLDNVSDSSQFDALAVEDWFGPGSRVVVTGRDKEVLNYRCSEIYKVEGLNHNDALQLFSMKAFKQMHPLTNFTELSHRALDYAKGFPLALKILGSQLFQRCAKDWEGILNKIKQSPHPDIIKILRTSFDELNQMEKDIFLDIACFLKGHSREWVECMLYGEHGISTSYGITRLVEKSLITVVGSRIEMHDLLLQMGQDIAQDSRLVNSQVICEILKDEGKVKAIEGIVLDMCKMENVQLSHAAFSLMPNLRYLKIHGTYMGSERDKNESSMWKSGQQRFHQFFLMNFTAYLEKIVGSTFEFQPKQIHFFSRRLSVFHWEEYPCQSLPTNIFMENIVDINMERSKIEKLWDGNKCPPRLKWLNLSHSMHLKRLPDLSSALDLEEIILKNCRSLMEFPSSIQNLRKLWCIDFNGCENLRTHPSLELKSLKVIRVSKCLNVEIFPATTSLKRHRIYPSLSWLEIMECKWLKSLPSGIRQMKQLAHLILNDCSNLVKLPALDGLRYLKSLYLRGTSIRKIPNLVSLSSLYSLHVNNCSRLQSLPELPSQLCFVDASNCPLLETSGSTSRLTSLNFADLKGTECYCTFNFLNCVNLEENTRCNFTRDALVRIKGIANMKNELKHYNTRVIFPGSEIPEWFSHQCPGSSIDLEVKQSNPSCFNSALLDFAFSIVVELKTVPADAFNSIDVTCKCRFKGPNANGNAKFKITETIGNIDVFASDHVLLWYSSCSRDLSGWLIQNHCSVNEASFEFEAKLGDGRNTKVDVKRCGVHLVFADNEHFQATNLDQAMEMESNSTHKRIGLSMSEYEEEGRPFKRFRYFCCCYTDIRRCYRELCSLPSYL